MRVDMKKDVIYRCIGHYFENGILACGYMPKPTKEHSQFDFQIGYYSCFYVLSGNGIYHTKGGEQIPIHSGHFVQRFPGERHSTEIVPDGKWLEFFISFGRTTFEYLCSLQLLSPTEPVRSVCIDENLLLALDRQFLQLKHAPDEELPFLSFQLQETILRTLHHIRRDPLQETIDEACRMLSANIQLSISPEDVADALHVSYDSLRKQFKLVVGVSPAQYRIMQKMKHAKLMLLSGVSIKETALSTGYGDTYSFTKQFTHAVGISPGRFQRQEG